MYIKMLAVRKQRRFQSALSNLFRLSFLILWHMNMDLCSEAQLQVQPAPAVEQPHLVLAAGTASLVTITSGINFKETRVLKNKG